MPEGDTVWRTARRLDQALAGQVLTGCDLRWPSLATVDLSGAATTEVVSRGKHILHRLDSGLTLHSHLRMEGQWWVSGTRTLSRHRLAGDGVRAVVSTEQWSAVGTRLGMLDVVRTADEHTLVGHLGPDVLGVDWDPDAAVMNLLRVGSEPVGAALLDQRNLAGVGTFYACEVLFLQRVGPWVPVAELGPAALDRIVRQTHRLLDANRHGATQTTTGIARRGQNAYVHGRSGQPCRACGGGVRVAMIGTAPRQRTVFYCPACQGGLGATDDARVQRPLGSSREGRGAATPRRQRPAARR